MYGNLHNTAQLKFETLPVPHSIFLYLISSSAKSIGPDLAANILETAVFASKCPTRH
jgi:hypothetical protein